MTACEKIDRAAFDPARAIDLKQARAMIRGRSGPACLEVVRRWANPSRGCRPAGAGGPVLVLPSVRVNGQKLTMPEWVEAFERERFRLGAGPARPRKERGARSRAAALRRAEAELDAARI